MHLLLFCMLAASPALDAAEAALVEFDAQGALGALDKVEQSGPLDLEQQIRFHEYAGIAHAYLEQNELSLAAFAKLLSLPAARYSPAPIPTKMGPPAPPRHWTPPF